MPNSGYYSPFSGAQVDAAVSAVLALPASGAIASAISSVAVSGAIISGAEFTTIVGDYTLTVSSGGVLVSGTSGEQLLLSGGSVRLQAAETAMGDKPGLLLSPDGTVEIYNGYDPRITMNADYETHINAPVYVENSLYVESREALTGLTVSGMSDTAIGDPTLSVNSGISYIYTNPVSSGAIVIDSGCRAQIKFTTLSANIPFMFPTGASFIGTSQFDSGSSYLIAINYPEVVCVPYTTVTSA